ncbi:MAG: bifunctional (p)ppGpp synthetase/guanosine-3',5'-bis(diphosphate) 3'-pyrophosphohydrolase [Firmicutes bacterium]|nr:bifunctional (p)ppGpp synthetase/guanosine-3',5'-bis(diphosphate) 3'-pyrophosphohydrolase [Bacillota bacterium]
MEKAGSKNSRRYMQEVYEFAKAAHAGQTRDSGEAYINHPLGVAAILVDMGLDRTSIAAALLHDVVEDTSIKLEEIQERFGPEVATLVDGVTKLSRISFQSQQEQQVENLRKMFLAMAKDIRVILIKLADRMHNMRTLKYLPVEKQKKIARETLEIYAPLTHRLGMYKFKWELEDLALRFLEPQKYYELVQKVAKKRQEREGYIEKVRKELEQQLASLGIRAEVQGRPKHFYSIYHKMTKQDKPFEEIYDLMALRVLVESIPDCYEALGVVHNLWKPMPGGFKDYIAMPKSNMYQSLHTRVVGDNGEPLEIQSRTGEMHMVAEYGIAAHWRDKQGGTNDETLIEKIAWLRQLLEWQQESKDADEYLENLRFDLFEDEVFVFTPKGDVKNLPAGATPVDFAYHIHTHIGQQCVGAKVNGRLVPLSYKLQNGDIVQILTSKQAGGPSSDWLKFVVTSKAKSKIRQWLREQRRDEYIQQARDNLEKEIKKRGLDPQEYLKAEVLKDAAERLGFTEADDLLVAVGDGKITAAMVVGKILGDKDPGKQAKLPAPGRKRSRSTGGVIVKGVEGLLIRFSRCCNPVPGDEIIGYITRGKGVAVHRINCSNMPEDTERLIAVEWAKTGTGIYPFEVKIEATDRLNLLAEIMNMIAARNFNVSAAKVTTRKGMAFIDLTLDITHLNDVKDLLAHIKQVKGVQRIHRVSRVKRT